MSNQGPVNPGSRGRLVVQGSARNTPASTAYNRSSLALDLDDTLPAEMALPRLVPASAGVGAGALAAGVPTFMGLDIATQQKDPTSKWVSAVIHVVAISAILWL